MSITFETVTVAAVLASAGTSAAIDVRTRRVPNALTLAIAIVGLAAAVAGVADLSVRNAMLGCAAGMALMLPGYLWGGTGGGDVKLMASLGTWLGPHLIVRTFFYSAIAGGLIALVIAARRRRIGATLQGAARLVAAPMNAKREIETVGQANRFPYAPAIAAGTVMAMLGL